MTIQASPQAECKSCGKSFLRFLTTQAVCSPTCAHRYVMATKKAEKEQTRARRLAVKPRSKWLAEAQQAFNAYIRARDEALPCISCGRHHAGSHDAGHYLTTGARPELRFNEDNVHRQCVRCNQHLHGNLVLYRLGLIARRGLAVVEDLEGPHPPAKYTVDDLRRIRDTYRAKARELAKQLQEVAA